MCVITCHISYYYLYHHTLSYTIAAIEVIIPELAMVVVLVVR